MFDIFTIRILLVITFILIFITVLAVIFLVIWIKRRKRSARNVRVSPRVVKSYDDEPEIIHHSAEPPSEFSFMNDNSDYFGGSFPNGASRHYLVTHDQPVVKLQTEYNMISRANHSQPDVICREIFHAAEANVTHFLYDYAYAHQQLPPHDAIYFKNNDQKYQLSSEARSRCLPLQPPIHNSHQDHNISSTHNQTFQIVSLVHEAPPDLTPIHLNTPLARLSPNTDSETSQLALRVLTLQDISRKEFQPVLFETTTTSSGDVSKGVQRSSNSEASWNKPIPANDWNSVPDLVSKLTANNLATSQAAVVKNIAFGVDAIATSGVDIRNSKLLAENVNIHSASSSESGDDSFTCSEFDDGEHEKAGETLRGSFLTLLDEDIPLSSAMLSTDTVLDLDYVLSWGPNFESLAGVFEDIAELPDSAAERTNQNSGSKSRQVEVYV